MFYIKTLLNGNNEKNTVLSSDEGVAASYTKDNGVQFHRKLVFWVGVIQCSKLNNIRIS